jgi:ATP-dependent DNA helicase 2 subunit 2
VTALLGQQRPRHDAKISEANSVPEFKQVLALAGDLAVVEDAVKQMGEIVRSLVRNSTGDSGYDRAAENMRVMRAELVNLEEPAMYNAFVRDLKKRLLAGELDGDRRLMWLKVGWERLGLITQEQAEGADVTEKEAEEVSVIPVSGIKNEHI